MINTYWKSAKMRGNKTNYYHVVREGWTNPPQVFPAFFVLFFSVSRLGRLMRDITDHEISIGKVIWAELDLVSITANEFREAKQNASVKKLKAKAAK